MCVEFCGYEHRCGHRLRQVDILLAQDKVGIWVCPVCATPWQRLVGYVRWGRKWLARKWEETKLCGRILAGKQ